MHRTYVVQEAIDKLVQTLSDLGDDFCFKTFTGITYAVYLRSGYRGLQIRAALCIKVHDDDDDEYFVGPSDVDVPYKHITGTS